MKPKNSSGFTDKHAGVTPDSAIREELLKRQVNGRVTCAVAFHIAADLAVSPAQVGVTADLVNMKISKCQLGLFGYRPDNKEARTDRTMGQPVTLAVSEAQVENRIKCKDAWDIAARLKVGKIAVGIACEGLGVKIKSCQLGAF